MRMRELLRLSPESVVTQDDFPACGVRRVHAAVLAGTCHDKLKSAAGLERDEASCEDGMTSPRAPQRFWREQKGMRPAGFTIFFLPPARKLAGAHRGHGEMRGTPSPRVLRALCG